MLSVGSSLTASGRRRKMCLVTRLIWAITRNCSQYVTAVHRMRRGDLSSKTCLMLSTPSTLRSSSRMNRLRKWLNLWGLRGRWTLGRRWISSSLRRWRGCWKMLPIGPSTSQLLLWSSSMRTFWRLRKSKTTLSNLPKRIRLRRCQLANTLSQLRRIMNIAQASPSCRVHPCFPLVKASSIIQETCCYLISTSL